MNISELLTELNGHDVSISLDGGDLLIDYEGDTLADTLVDKIKTNKGQLVAYLKKYVSQQDFIAIQRVPVQESYPVSYAQKRLWILSQYTEISKAYTIPNQVELYQELDMEKFTSAVNAVIERHEVLRTVFREDEKGEVRQLVLPAEALNFDIEFLDFSKQEDAATQADKYIEADGFKVFDLASGPLFRASLIKLSDKRYRFYYIMHHIISDGWSLGVLINDVLVYYNAFTKNTTPGLDPLTIQYKDYTHWQLSQLRDDNISKDKDYWLSQFKDEIPLLEIPGRPVRPAIKTNNGEILETYLSKETTAKLKQFTQAQEGSMFITLLSLWNALLCRYMDQQELVIGTAVAGRDHAGLEDQIGFYVNTLALRNSISRNETFADYYTKVKTNALDAFSHQTFPFDLLVESLELVRDNSRNPLFDVMLTLLSTNADNAQAEPDQVLVNNIRYKGKRNAKFDIEINVVETAAHLQMLVNYNTDVYDAAFITQMLRHFRQLANAVLANPHKPVNKYDLLSVKEREQLLNEFNDTKQPFPDNKTIIELFEAQVSSAPGHVAVLSDEGAMTYEQLNEAANKLGLYLRQQYHVEPDDMVGIELPRTNALMIAIFGVLKAGGAYVPIDPANPMDRKDYIKADAGCKCIIDQVFMEQFSEIANGFVCENPAGINNANSLVYVIYTSGSTGNPKGVMIENRSLVNRLVWMQKAYPLSTSDVILQKTTYSFDVSVWELLWWSLYGAKVQLLEPEGEKNPSTIVQTILAAGVTVMHFVPSMLSAFLNYLKQFPNEKNKLRSLTQVFTSGEALSKDHRDQLLEELPWVSLMNLYGPTEASIDVTWYDCSEQRNDHIIPIGKPIDNTQMYILDQDLQLTPIGIKGRLYIAGIGLARGYANNEELTNKKFISHPFQPGQRLYNTGDIAQWLPDGNINFLGRADDQVKVRGFRIELGEIEYHLRSKDGIDDAVVLLKTSAAGQQDLIAFIVAKEEQQVAMLRNYLAAKVPHYMVPAYFVQVKHIPLSASGKANKKQLLSLDNLALADKVAYVAPGNQQEQALITVCELVLNRKQLSVKENFYNLGGDSIKSIQMVSRLKQLGYTLRVEDILRTPVLESLAALLAATTHKTDQSIVSGQVVLTPIQHYFFENTPVPNYFNQSVLLKSEAPMDVDILKRCFKQLVTHHDALRIIFKQQREGTWEQFNNGPDALNYEFNSWDLRNKKQPLEELKAVTGEMQASFDLSTGPLLKVGHFKLKDGERLAIIIHHLATDGVSWRILLEDLLTLYRQCSENTTLILPAKTDSFQRWAQLQLEHAISGKLREADYWTAVCEQEIPVLKTEYPHQGRIFLEDRATFTLDEPITQLLQTKFHTVYNTEINDVLLTGLGLAIREVLGQDKVMLKMEGHGREEIMDNIDISRTVGWFTTMYPFILNLEHTTNAVESLIKVKEDLRKIPNKGIGYGMLRYLNSSYGNLDYKPTVIFNFLGDFDSSFTDKDNSRFTYATEAIGANIAKQNTDEVLLNVSGSIVTGKLYISINYSRLVHNEQTITKLLAAYKKHLAGLIEELSREQYSFKTPSDLTFRGLIMKEIAFINDDHDLEDVYELSPLQQGIYYHWLTGNSKSQYVEQISYRIHAKEIKIDLIRKAYQKLLERYAVLRTGFVSHVRDFPLQVVRKDVHVRFYYEDIPESLDEKDIEIYIRQYKLADRNEGFDLADDSLMRLNILNAGNDCYEFIWSHHHILMDGWCMGILIQDFNRILNAVSKNIPVDLPATKPYADYIRWLSGLDTTVSLNYWRKYLEDYTATAGVPFLKNTQEAIYREAVSSLKIEGALLSKLQTFCSELGITQSTFLQSAWGFLLSQYNYTNDVVFGAVVSGRPGALNDVERMVGLFINTIPVRIRYRQDQTPFTLLKEVQEAGINSHAHHYLNLARVQSQSEFGAALLNHIMVFENFPVKEAISENNGNAQLNMSIQRVEVFEQTNYDLNIIVLPSQNALQVDVRFNAGKYESDGMDVLATHFYNVIEQFANTGDQPLQQISYLSAKEQDQILNEFNATDVVYEAGKTVLDLFRERVAEMPDQIAVRFADEQLSYRELDIVTGQLAHYLHTRYGVELNDLAGIRLERSVSMLVAILGILKAGGAYVPVDTTYPEQRIQYIREDSNYKVCIDEELMQAFRSAAGPVMEDLKLPGSAAAYAIYTSGSTGNPKGVLNEHAGLYNRLLWMRDDLGIDAHDIILQKTPYTFDVSVWELLMPVITGSKLVFAKPEGHKDPLYLQELIAKEQITILHFVPSMLGIFLENLEREKCRSIKHIVCSGEALSPVLAEECKEKLSWVRLYNLYGPTEAAIDVTSVELTDVDTTVSGVSIGKPVANTRIYIVDKNLNPQPVGVPGELLIEGIQVARGYLNQPELSATKFMDSPFNPGDRIYRTGDLAKWLPNGEIAYMGRMDDQVKIRGNRIELGEVETRIMSVGYVEQAAVIVKGDALRKYLVAYVIPREGYNREELYKHLGTQLPEYMIPGMIMELESFPLTSSGKLNRRALPEPSEVDATPEAYIAPRNEMEEVLEGIWKEVLGLEKVSIHDNFFRIGGDSIISIRLISRVNKQFNVALSIGQLYESSTITGISNVLKHYMDVSASREKIKNEVVTQINEVKERILTDIPGIENIEDIYPMSDIQKGMVILSSLNPGAGVYHDQFIFHIPTVRMDLFKQAFSILVKKHAAFRTRFDLISYGQEIQIIDRHIDVSIDHHDINELDKTEQEEYIRNFMKSERTRPFDIGSGPMWRAAIFSVSPGKNLFLLQFHHAILDGWSIASFNTELFKVYQELSNGINSKIEKLRATVRDAVIEELCEKKNAETIQFWQQELADYKRLNLFGNKFCNLDVSKSYDFGFRYNLEQKCSNEGISLKTVIYGAFVYVIGVLSGEEDFVTGMVTNNRPVMEEGDKILGCFLNTIPIRNRMEGNGKVSWNEYFKNVERQLISLKSKEHLTLYEITKITNEKVTTGSPFFDIMFNYVDFHIYKEIGVPNQNAGVDQRKKSLDVGSYESTNTAFDFNVNLSGNELVIDYKLRKELMPGITLEKIHQCLDQVLSAYLHSPEQITSTTRFLTPTERNLVCNEFNATDVVYEAGKTVLDLFRERVAEMPDQIAVRFADEQLSYRELDIVTGQLAHYLHTRYGVELNDLAGIRLERSVSMLVAILGILKAGGAYVPVDTTYPEQRIQYIREDSNYKVCIDEELMQAFRSAAGPVMEDLKLPGSAAAYAIYTSGSTGNPKGVLNEHAGLYNRLLWMRDDLGIDAHDIILQKTPYTFDVSVWELLMPVITGSKLVFAKPEGHKDPLYLQELIAKEQITILHFVPSMLGIFLENLEREKCRSIKHIVCSGEALSPVLAEECKEKLSWVRLYNLYGPTEAAIDVTSVELTDVDTTVSGVSIGKPVANTRIYIVDKNLNPQPVGVPGELLIEGIQVARGYLNQPELSATKFMDSPFNPGDRIYRTGDLAKWLPNGEIAYMGRMDDQVKIRGNRIELGEVETRIMSVGYVEQAAVIVKGDALRKYLVAYVIPREGYNREELYKHLGTQLPEYMIPGMIMELESFPLTSSGKLNRRALPEPSEVDATPEAYIAPRNEMEEVLEGIWKEVLGLEKVSIHDNFFRIGGDSIISIRLISRVNKQFNVALSIGQLYESSTISGISDQITNNTVSNEDNQKIRDDIRTAMDSWKNEIMNNLNVLNNEL